VSDRLLDAVLCERTKLPRARWLAGLWLCGVHGRERSGVVPSLDLTALLGLGSTEACRRGIAAFGGVRELYDLYGMIFG